MSEDGPVGDWTNGPHAYLGNQHPAHLGVSCHRYQQGERPAQERRVQTVAVDFDGVVHRYGKGWHDGTIYDEPEPGAIDGIRKLQQEYAVFVFTSRDVGQVGLWLIDQGLGPVAIDDGTAEFWGRQDAVLVTNRKLPAVAYLDDRAVPFIGWPAVLLQIHGLTRFKGSPPALAVASDADWQRLEEGEVVNHILRGAPESWAEDAAPGHIATAYVRELERRLDAAGISRERYAEPEGHVIELREDGWTIQHPLSCRPDLFACAFNRAALSTTYQGITGRFRCELAGDGGIVLGEAVHSGR